MNSKQIEWCIEHLRNLRFVKLTVKNDVIKMAVKISEGSAKAICMRNCQSNLTGSNFHNVNKDVCRVAVPRLHPLQPLLPNCVLFSQLCLLQLLLPIASASLSGRSQPMPNVLEHSRFGGVRRLQACH